MICAPRSRVEHDHASIVHPAVRVFESLREQRLQGLSSLVPTHIEHGSRRQKLAAAKVIVKEKPEADQPCRADTALVIGQDETHRPDDVRRHRPENFTLHQRFAHQTKLVVLQIAQAAVNELRRAGRRTRGKIVHLGERNGITATDGVTRDSAAVDAATDNKNIVNLTAHVPLRARKCRTAKILSDCESEHT
jgi:hypothetical protein